MNDFGLKYFNQQEAQEFLKHLGTKYKHTLDWSGRNLCGLTFDWDYNKGHLVISMPNYVIDNLNRLQHNKTQPQYSPHVHLPIIHDKA